MSLDDAVSTDQQRRHARRCGRSTSAASSSLSRRDDRRPRHTGASTPPGRPSARTTGSRDGANAAYTVAGDATTYTSHTNVATDGLPGVELTFKSIGTSTVTVSAPAANPADVATKLKAFVSAYNDAVDLVRSKLTEKRVVNPQSDADAQAGALFGDDCARQRADQHAPGDLRPPAWTALGVTVAVDRQRHLARRAGRQAHLRPGGLRRRVGRGPDRRQGQARLARRLGLRAGLRGPAGPDHARRRRPAWTSASATPTAS